MTFETEPSFSIMKETVTLPLRSFPVKSLGYIVRLLIQLRSPVKRGSRSAFSYTVVSSGENSLWQLIVFVEPNNKFATNSKPSVVAVFSGNVGVNKYLIIGFLYLKFNTHAIFCFCYLY